MSDPLPQWHILLRAARRARRRGDFVRADRRYRRTVRELILRHPESVRLAAVCEEFAALRLEQSREAGALALLRLLITAAIQAPVALVLAYYIAARTRIDRWQEP